MPVVGIMLGVMCALFWIVFQMVFAIGHMCAAMIFERRKRMTQ